MNTTTSQRLRRQLEQTSGSPDVTQADIAQLDDELANILKQLAAKQGVEQAALEFSQLVELHGLLARLLFKHRIALSERQEKFVRVFDRWDDQDTKEYFYREVISGRL